MSIDVLIDVSAICIIIIILLVYLFHESTELRTHLISKNLTLMNSEDTRCNFLLDPNNKDVFKSGILFNHPVNNGYVNGHKYKFILHADEPIKFTKLDLIGVDNRTMPCNLSICGADDLSNPFTYVQEYYNSKYYRGTHIVHTFKPSKAYKYYIVIIESLNMANDMKIQIPARIELTNLVFS